MWVCSFFEVKLPVTDRMRIRLHYLICIWWMPGASPYAAGKAALNSLAKTSAIELAAQKIRVNVVSPGPDCQGNFR